MLTAEGRPIVAVPEGDLFTVPGLRGAAVATGVKRNGALDLALIVADETMSAAAVFTRCSVAAPPVVLGREQLTLDPHLRAIVINAGNANALTGERGTEDAKAMRRAVERGSGGPGLVLSTGVIGEPLDLPPVLEGIEKATGKLSADPGRDVSEAILTTDTCTKQAAVRIDGLHVGGIAKGSGMIHPDMATMLAVIATDAQIGPRELDPILRTAVDRSFHEISVDGDTSTNDAVVLLARKPSSRSPAPDRDLRAVADGITETARSLALQIVQDGEGRSRLLHLSVTGAETETEARSVARTIACSSLVKTALAGGDANWGRILAAAGNSGVPVDARLLTLSIGGIPVFREGAPVDFDESAVSTAFRKTEVQATLDLGRGAASARMVTTDLTRRYVEINADYRS